MREKTKKDYYMALAYRVDLFMDPRDKVWIARYPELPGTKADGKTPREALKALEEIKEAWLEAALQRGRDIPEPEPEPIYSGKLNVRLPKTLHERAANAARIDGVSLNTYIIQAITEKVDRSWQKQVVLGLQAAVQGLPSSGSVSWNVSQSFGTSQKPIAQHESAKLTSEERR